ncbi:Uncharacterised protein [Amycolatopsis camponoti]|uniref:Uncharacterized protein n=1 Tax=Amycolatopsis camponoti TaxID=2606593 RepID=A0A6I8M331_9PSEU|nr:Uncharacterised protein [Amycolatopsis camponoti]
MRRRQRRVRNLAKTAKENFMITRLTRRAGMANRISAR